MPVKGHRWARQAESARAAGHWQTAIGKHTRGYLSFQPFHCLSTLIDML
jgi:hypothetical protein